MQESLEKKKVYLKIISFNTCAHKMKNARTASRKEEITNFDALLNTQELLGRRIPLVISYVTVYDDHLINLGK
jgi:hypothetical protein